MPNCTDFCARDYCGIVMAHWQFVFVYKCWSFANLLSTIINSTIYAYSIKATIKLLIYTLYEDKKK